ncbi:hypothetical protein FRC10_010383 [Ceratobasidium sp. 414]|nr:hypothetical protein FRC10_010383 [Ceratobasidium sp. 414]
MLRIMILFVWSLFIPYVAPQSPVRLDDSVAYSVANPSGVQYSLGGWSNNNSDHAAQWYLGTYHVSSAKGASIIFFFRGSSISYYADKSPNGGPITVVLDGAGGQTSTVSGLSTTGQAQFQQQLWSWAGLDSGDHQVLICNSGGNEMGLDFFEVMPNDGSTGIAPAEYGPGAFSIPAEAILIDDPDRSVIYSGFGWRAVSDVPGQNVYFQGTMRTTSTPGDRCTFTFNGTGVWYFTDYRPGNAFVSISIDGALGETINTAPTGNTARTQHLAWSKTGLNNGLHVLTLTHAGNAGSPMSIDFFEYLPSNGSSTPLSSSTPSATVPPSLTSESVSISIFVSTPPPSSTSTSETITQTSPAVSGASQSNMLPRGIITVLCGIVVAAVVV